VDRSLNNVLKYDRFVKDILRREKPEEDIDKYRDSLFHFYEEEVFEYVISKYKKL
jgi:hypothetical protein